MLAGLPGSSFHLCISPINFSVVSLLLSLIFLSSISLSAPRGTVIYHSITICRSSPCSIFNAFISVPVSLALCHLWSDKKRKHLFFECFHCPVVSLSSPFKSFFPSRMLPVAMSLCQSPCSVNHHGDVDDADDIIMYDVFRSGKMYQWCRQLKWVPGVNSDIGHLRNSAISLRATPIHVVDSELRGSENLNSPCRPQ